MRKLLTRNTKSDRKRKLLNKKKRLFRVYRLKSKV